MISAKQCSCTVGSFILVECLNWRWLPLWLAVLFSQFVVIPVALFEHLLKVIDFGIPIIEYHRRLSGSLYPADILNQLPFKRKRIHNKQTFKLTDIYSFSKVLAGRYNDLKIDIENFLFCQSIDRIIVFDEPG